MAGVTKVEIFESAEKLHDLLRKQKTALGKEGIQALYLLKIGRVKTIQDLAVVLARGTAYIRFLRIQLGNQLKLFAVFEMKLRNEL
ncbi:MAG: hypothetical protein HWQ40_14840 [Nostoc sp. NMS9]|nr:hypothetical protein [Nostoc sp. NMS9]